MQNVEFSKDKFNSLYGLSCIENYLLFYLKEQNYPYKYLFFASYLPYEDIIHFINIDKVEYAFFYGVERIHNIAKANGLLKIYGDTTLNISFFDEHEFVCVMVDPNHIKKAYNTTLLRGDHYILIKKNNNSFSYINDSPKDVGELTIDELYDIFGGKIMAIDIEKTLDNNLINQFLSTFMQKISEERKNNLSEVNDILVARDVLGICRVLRRRLYEYASLYTDVQFFIPYLEYLDKTYALIEYMRLRHRIDFGKINEILVYIGELDNENISKLKNRFNELFNNEYKGDRNYVT